MDLRPSDLQESLRQHLDRLLGDLSGPEDVRAAEPLGFHAKVWSALADMGVPTMALPEARGGQGASLADLGVAAERCGRALAPAPVVEAAVAARLLAAAGEPGAAHLARVVDDGALVTVALRPASAGTATLVPGGAVADAAVVLDGDDLVVVDLAGVERRAVENLGSGPLADLALADVPRTVLATAAEAKAAHTAAVDEWRALTALWLVGLGERALEIGVQYATERHQFGVPIGSFQVIQHRLADLRTHLDGAALLARKAVWALDTSASDDRGPLATRFAPMAFTFAGEAAEATAAASLHVHGGYGFMDEYDIQLHFRRAKGTRLLLGDPRRELQVVADRLWPRDPSGAPPSSVPSPIATTHPASGHDFALPAEVESFRAEVRAFLAEHVTDEVIERAHRTGTIHDHGLHRAMAEAGWISAGWPVELGGQGRSPLEMNALTEEMYFSGAPADGIGVAALVAHTLRLCGTEEHQRDIIPRILSGEVLCCLGYSEPDAGSDVAAATTKAVRDGDHWVVTGQKMFTTLAHEAQYVLLLTRTNTEVAKHRGLTMFIVPMDLPGIDITPVHTMGGERTNITYYDDVQVPDRYRVGEVDGGWDVLMAALVFERNSAWYGEAVRLLDHAVGWAAEADADPGRAGAADGAGKVIDDPLVRERLARAAIGNEVANLLGWRAAWMAANEELPGVEGTMAKLFTTEHYQRAAGDLIDVLGAEGLRRHGEPGAAADGWVEATYRHCQVTTIYGGTSEVCRGIIAERGLGLPRAGR